MDVRYLWLQTLIFHREVDLRKVPGEQNMSDLLTKHVPHVRAKLLLNKMGVFLDFYA